jgi:hypothetical protein
MLGVTVCSDVIVLLIVTLMSSVATSSCSESSFDGIDIGIVLVNSFFNLHFHLNVIVDPFFAGDDCIVTCLGFRGWLVFCAFAQYAA